jgi:ribose transport system substrate-binding protein
MSTGSLARGRGKSRTLAVTGLAAALAASLAACGSGSGATSDPSSSAAPGSSGSAGSAGSSSSASGSGLAAEVAALTKPLNSYPVPTAKVGDVSSLSGKTIYYIPISQQAPQFTITANALTAAAKTVGMKVQVCDGKGTPSDINACVGQATQAKAAAIIADAIPYVLAANSLGAAQKAGIPVVIGNNVPDKGVTQSKTLAYVGYDSGSAMEAALAKWITMTSGGNANVLINEDTDGPSPAVFASAGQKVFDNECSGCKVTVNKVSSSNFSLVPSSTSAALLKDPSITYVESQYEQFLQATQAGVQQTSRKVTTVDGAAQLDSVKAVANGTVAAAAGQASAYEGWVFLDAVLRMSTGDKLPTYTIPVRLFTKDTVTAADQTEQAQDTGSWFGPTTFTSDFEKLWGVA